MDWGLTEAKNKFSELFNRALTEGPQRVRRRGETIVVMAARDYDRLIGRTPGFKDFLLGAVRTSTVWISAVTVPPCGMLTCEGIA